METTDVLLYLSIVIIALLFLTLLLTNGSLLRIFHLKNKCELQLTNEVHDVTQELCEVIINDNELISEDGTRIKSVVNKQIKKKQKEVQGILNMQLSDKPDNLIKDFIIEDLEDMQNSALSMDNNKLFIQKSSKKKAEHKYIDHEVEEEEVEYNGEAIGEFLRQNILQTKQEKSTNTYAMTP